MKREAREISAMRQPVDDDDETKKKVDHAFSHCPIRWKSDHSTGESYDWYFHMKAERAEGRGEVMKLLYKDYDSAW